MKIRVFYKKCLANFLTGFFLVFFMYGFVSASAPSQSQEREEENKQKQQTQDGGQLSLDVLLDVDIDVSSTTIAGIFRSPSTVSIITRDMIRNYNFLSVSEILQIVAGFSVNRTYLKRNLPTARGILQDHYANKVLLLMNGIPTWNAVTGESNLDRININDIERIEVLRGPASVPLGTNAYSGAVNIVLKKKRTNGGELHLTVGDQHAVRGGSNLEYSKSNFSIFLSGSAFDETGRDLLFTDESGESGHIRDYLKTSHFTVHTTFSNHSLFINGFTSHESYLGVVPTFASGAGHDHLIRGYLLNYTYAKRFSDKFRLKAGLTYDWNQRNFSRSRDDIVRANVEGMRLHGFINSHIKMSRSFKLSLGTDIESRNSIEYKNYNVQLDEVLADNNLKDQSVYEYSFFGQLGFSRKPVYFLLGSRLTKNKLFGTNISSRATMVLSLNKKNTFKFIWGQSFRAPSLFELYFETPGKTVFGDENLLPEKSNSFEASYLTSFGKFYIQALVYYAIYENKIFRIRKDIERNGDIYENINVYSNGQEFNAKGLELEIKYNNPLVLSGFLNYNFVDGNTGDEIDGSGHYNFKYIPQHVLSLGLNRNFKKLSISAVYRYQSATEGPISKIESQSFLDFNLKFEHKLSNVRLEHNVSVKNVFNDDLLIPEYVRRGGLNAIPFGYGRRIMYTIRICFHLDK